MPVPKGGGVKLVDALAGIVRAGGGALETGQDVEHVLVDNGKAIGVRIGGGATVAADRVVANVTPTQLYGRLLADAHDLPEPAREAGRRFRYGRAEMQIHFALDEPPRWDGDERLGRTAILHLTPGLDGVSRAVNEAERGLLPAEATIVLGQPLAVDPSRAPEGKSILWIQLQELPRRPVGDAAGEIETGDGTWTDGLKERYADRIQARIARHVTEPRVGAPEAGRPLACRHRAGERQPRRRRHLLGLVRARPEPALASAAHAAGPSHPRPGPLAHRGEHASRPGSRRRVGDDRRERAAAREPRAARALGPRPPSRQDDRTALTPDPNPFKVGHSKEV